nr:MAG TPA: hypothetical protein [Caudoviricetes sp.]
MTLAVIILSIEVIKVSIISGRMVIKEPTQILTI